MNFTGTITLVIESEDLYQGILAYSLACNGVTAFRGPVGGAETGILEGKLLGQFAFQ